MIVVRNVNSIRKYFNLIIIVFQHMLQKKKIDIIWVFNFYAKKNVK